LLIGASAFAANTDKKTKSSNITDKHYIGPLILTVSLFIQMCWNYLKMEQGFSLNHLAKEQMLVKINLAILYTKNY